MARYAIIGMLLVLSVLQSRRILQQKKHIAEIQQDLEMCRVAFDTDGSPPYQWTATPLTITTTSIPNVELGHLYNVQFAATGGIPPYTWRLVKGGEELPPTMKLLGNGTLIVQWLPSYPKERRCYWFTVSVTDRAGNISEKPFSLEVAYPSPRSR